jgi:hypothetical protein
MENARIIQYGAAMNKEAENVRTMNSKFLSQVSEAFKKAN